jgi:hypothetical protein
MSSKDFFFLLAVRSRIVAEKSSDHAAVSSVGAAR